MPLGSGSREVLKLPCSQHVLIKILPFQSSKYPLGKGILGYDVHEILYIKCEIYAPLTPGGQGFRP